MATDRIDQIDKQRDHDSVELDQDAQIVAGLDDDDTLIRALSTPEALAIIRNIFCITKGEKVGMTKDYKLRNISRSAIELGQTVEDEIWRVVNA